MEKLNIYLIYISMFMLNLDCCISEMLNQLNVYNHTEFNETISDTKITWPGK